MRVCVVIRVCSIADAFHRIRPAVMEDGGDFVFRKFDEETGAYRAFTPPNSILLSRSSSRPFTDISDPALSLSLSLSLSVCVCVCRAYRHRVLGAAGLMLRLPIIFRDAQERRREHALSLYS